MLGRRGWVDGLVEFLEGKRRLQRRSSEAGNALMATRHLRIKDFPDIVQCNRVEEEAPVKKNVPSKSVRSEKSTFGKDRRRKHHHYLVTVSYADGEKFGRVYTDKEKATRFAERQRKWPVVKAARISQVS